MKLLKSLESKFKIYKDKIGHSKSLSQFDYEEILKDLLRFKHSSERSEDNHSLELLLNSFGTFKNINFFRDLSHTQARNVFVALSFKQHDGVSIISERDFNESYVYVLKHLKFMHHEVLFLEIEGMLKSHQSAEDLADFVYYVGNWVDKVDTKLIPKNSYTRYLLENPNELILVTKLGMCLRHVLQCNYLQLAQAVTNYIHFESASIDKSTYALLNLVSGAMFEFEEIHSEALPSIIGHINDLVLNEDKALLLAKALHIHMHDVLTIN